MCVYACVCVCVVCAHVCVRVCVRMCGVCVCVLCVRVCTAERMSISELRRLYFRLCECVFFSNLPPEERGRELERFAKEVFGSTRRMEDMRDEDGPKSVPPQHSLSSLLHSLPLCVSLHPDSS